VDYVWQAVPVLIFIGLVAVFSRLAGRLFAHTRMAWAPCLKYAAIVVALLGVLSLGLAGAAAVTGPRVIQDSGVGLGRVKGAFVGVAAAFLLMGVAFVVVLALFMLGIARM
jgi:hypothetical protein